jgi:hypothetical protein
VVEEHDLCRSEYAGRNNKLSENIFGYRGSAGSDNVDIGPQATPKGPRTLTLGVDEETAACPRSGQDGVSAKQTRWWELPRTGTLRLCVCRVSAA